MDLRRKEGRVTQGVSKGLARMRGVSRHIRSMGLIALISLSILACRIPFVGSSATGRDAITPSPLSTRRPTIPQPTSYTARTQTPDPNLESSDEQLLVDWVEGISVGEGEWLVFGMVLNRSGSDVEAVLLEITATAASGEILHQGRSSTAFYHLAQGESSPFQYQVRGLPDEVDAFSAAIVDYVPTQVERPNFDLRDVQFQPAGGQLVHITGRLVNPGEVPGRIHNITAIITDKEGHPLSVGTAAAFTRYLDPGEDTPFRISVRAEESVIDTEMAHRIFLDAVMADPVDPLGVEFLDPLDFQDAQGEFHLVGEVLNPSEEPIRTVVIAAVYDREGRVLDVAEKDLVILDSSAAYDLSLWGPMNDDPSLYQEAVSYRIQWDPLRTSPLVGTVHSIRAEVVSRSAVDLGLQISGTVQNTSDEEVRSGILRVEVRDEGGVVGAVQAEIPELLGPGEEWIFDLMIPIPGGLQAESLTLQAEAFQIIP